MGLSTILLIDLILMRPYCKVSEKLRAIYFSMVYVGVSVIRYINNNLTDGKYSLFLAFIITMMLIVAIVWTLITLVIDFFNMISFHS